MKSVYFRNFIISAALVIMIFLVLAAAFVLMGRSFLASEKRENLNATATEIVESTRIVYIEHANLAILTLKMNISQISAVTGNHIFITDAQGTIENCSDAPSACGHIGMRVPGGIMRELRENGSIYKISDVGGIYGTKNYVAALPVTIPGSGSVVAYVFVAAEVSALMDAWETFLFTFAITAAFIMLVAIFMTYITSRQQSRPINEMAVAARHFAHGDFSVRVTEEYREDELGALTASFNAMAEALERSEELRSEFIANVSHELKTPVTTISGFADGILDGTIPPENQEKYLRTISEETKRLSRLVSSMLELSRIQSGLDKSDVLRREFDLTETVRRALINFEARINERGLDVSALLPEDGITVLGDGDAIMQVVYNLLDNAIKFSVPGSVLTVALWRQAGKAYVSVKNMGETIPPEELTHIFDRFHKTDRSRSLDRSGVGLGLYIVKTILNNHDEDITARSQDGITEFTFSLRLAPQAQQTRFGQPQRLPPQTVEPESL